MSDFPSFDDFFAALWTHRQEPARPFPWQRRLAEAVLDEGWPRSLDLPTGAGKTSVIDIWAWALAAGAAGLGPRQPRRLFFVIDRRIVVDSVFDRAQAIAHALERPSSQPLAAVAASLVGLGGERPLLAARLRGGLEIDREWAESVAQPLACASTVDQIGSRLLFRGYGLPRGPRNPLPIHAALVGTDALIVVDEAHLSTPFDETLDVIERLRAQTERELDLPWHCLRMTATPRPGDRTDGFALDTQDESDERLRRRLHVRKPARLVEVAPRRGHDPLVAAGIDEVVALLADERLRTIGVVVNRVARAHAIADRLRGATLDSDVLVLIGPSRPADRERAIEDAWPRLRAGRERDENARRLVVVATQTIEVGADLDFDAIVTEHAPADSLRQRFGRLDRLGCLDGHSQAVVIHTPARFTDPVYGDALEPAWAWLQSQAVEGVVDVGPQALAEPPADALSPRAHAPILFPAYLDRLVQTSPLPEPEPEVSVFLHGFDARLADVEIVWRADLDPAEPDTWRDIVALAPPSGREAVRIGFVAAKRWLSGLPAGDVADIEGGSEETDDDEAVDDVLVLRWRGPRESAPIGARDLRPGDTVVVPAEQGGCDNAGWSPGSREPVTDLVERIALDRGKPVLRLHPRVLAAAGTDPELASGLVVPDEDDPTIRVADREAIDRSVAVLAKGDSPLSLAAKELAEAGYHVIGYPGSERAFLSQVDEAPALWDDEGELSGASREVLLCEHEEGVARGSCHVADLVGLESKIVQALETAALLHDEGKRDQRFQKLLGGGSAIAGAEPLAKSRIQVRDSRSQRRAWAESGLPRGFRHEAGSVALVDGLEDGLDHDLVRHLIGSHHGYARPYLPVVDDADPRRIEISELQRVDGEVPERFWRLVRRYGWWGLAYLETVLRLADHRQSAIERTS